MSESARMVAGEKVGSTKQGMSLKNSSALKHLPQAENPNMPDSNEKGLLDVSPCKCFDCMVLAPPQRSQDEEGRNDPSV